MQSATHGETAGLEHTDRGCVVVGNFGDYLVHAEEIAGIVECKAHCAHTVAFATVKGVDVKTHEGTVVETVEVEDVYAPHGCSRVALHYHHSDCTGFKDVVVVVYCVVPKLLAAIWCRSVARVPLRGIVLPSQESIYVGYLDGAKLQYVVA